MTWSETQKTGFLELQPILCTSWHTRICCICVKSLFKLEIVLWNSVPPIICLSIRAVLFLNPFKPSVLFMGHRQTQTMHQCLIRTFTVCSQNFLLKFEKKWKIPPNIPKIGNGLVLLIKVGKSTMLKWVKQHLKGLIPVMPFGILS